MKLLYRLFDCCHFGEYRDLHFIPYGRHFCFVIVSSCFYMSIIPYIYIRLTQALSGEFM